MRKDPFRFKNLLFRFAHLKVLRRSCCILAAAISFSACNWATGVFEKNLNLPGHQWPAGIKPDIAFNISDTVSLYNVYIVIRHTDAYHFNNMYVRATVQEPGSANMKSGDYDLQLATNGKGWIGTAMDDIYDARLLIQPKTKFSKSGVYHITLEQLMREDPLLNVLSAGLRVEKLQ